MQSFEEWLIVAYWYMGIDLSVTGYTLYGYVLLASSGSQLEEHWELGEDWGLLVVLGSLDVAELGTDIYNGLLSFILKCCRLLIIYS